MQILCAGLALSGIRVHMQIAAMDQSINKLHDSYKHTHLHTYSIFHNEDLHKLNSWPLY